MEINIDEYLSPYSGMKLLYVPNPGNAGDNLIAVSTLQKFAQLNIDISFIDRHRLPLNNEIVIYSGGGNLAKANFSVSFVRRVHKNVKKLIVLPHTIHDVDPLLAELTENVDLICREKTSYAYLQKSGTRANVYLAKDMALSVDIQKAMQYEANFADKCGQLALYLMCKSRLSKKQAPTLRSLISLWRAPKITSSNDVMLNAFRTDGEKTTLALPANNIDIAEHFALGTETDVLVREGCARLLHYINQFDVINTNRLHVAISATLLGKKVNFYANNYFKCQAVYEYSLTHFPDLVWHGDKQLTEKKIKMLDEVIC